MAKRSRESLSFQEFKALYVRPKPGRTLIAGSRVTPGKSDRRSEFKDVIGVDMVEGPGVDLIHNLEYPIRGERFSHIECTSVLEHCQRPWLMAAALEQMLEPGGTIFVTVPLVWRIHDYPDDYWRMTPSAIRFLFPAIRWDYLKLAHVRVDDPPRIPALKDEMEHPYMARTDTCGFGHK